MGPRHPGLPGRIPHTFAGAKSRGLRSIWTQTLLRVVVKVYTVDMVNDVEEHRLDYGDLTDGRGLRMQRNSLETETCNTRCRNLLSRHPGSLPAGHSDLGVAPFERQKLK